MVYIYTVCMVKGGKGMADTLVAAKGGDAGAARGTIPTTNNVYQYCCMGRRQAQHMDDGTVRYTVYGVIIWAKGQAST